MRTIALLFALAFCPGALALEAGPGIKVTQIMKTTQSWDGKPLVYPAGQAEITAQIVEFAPGAETAWHQHPVPSFALILEGTLEVTLADGTKKLLQAGDPVAETVNTWHTGRNTGKTPVRLVVFYAGAVGQPLTVKKPVPAEKP
jgi:quercetin dioxygenase-like cupin family protein